MIDEWQTSKGWNDSKNILLEIQLLGSLVYLIHKCNENIAVQLLFIYLIDQFMNQRVRFFFVSLVTFFKFEVLVNLLDNSYIVCIFLSIIFLSWGKNNALEMSIFPQFRYTLRQLRLTSSNLRCSGEAFSNALLISHEHLLSSISVPILPINSGSP